MDFDGLLSIMKIQHNAPVNSDRIVTRSSGRLNSISDSHNKSFQAMAASSSSGNREYGGANAKKTKQPSRAKTVATRGRKRPGKFRVAYTNRKAIKLLSESGNNELSMDSMSFLSDEEKLLLSSWGLPTPVLTKYRQKGVTSLFQWQLECLDNEKVLKGANIVYSAPTSAGKTLVAEILMLKRVLELGKKAIMILPFVSVAREKMYSLQELFGDIGIRVEGFMGSYNPPGGFSQVDIAICTIEKANSLINRLLEEDDGLSQLGTIVVDELHLIGDSSRGYLLELLLTKIRFTSTLKYAQRNDSMSINSSLDFESEGGRPKPLNVQIIGMSATLPNLNSLAKWLEAELVISDFRPVPLVERIKLGDELYDSSLTKVGPVLKDPMLAQEKDSDHIISLSLETILDGHSILIFCPSKQMCESTAVRMSQEFRAIGLTKATVGSKAILCDKLRQQLNGGRIFEVLSQLAQCPAGLDDALKAAVSFGVAFHHAGLTYDERDIIESAFKRGILRVMIATSTLSAGVNLPARRVLIITPTFDCLDVLTYRQMSGRAGRKGVDTEGESILISDLRTQKRAIDLIQASLPPVSSALINANGTITQSMKRALLEVIASGVVKNPAEVKDYANCTLLSHIGDDDTEEEISDSEKVKNETVGKCLDFLEQNDFIRLKVYESSERSTEYMTTQLGSACLASSLSPDEGIIVLNELGKARRCFVLENELHVVYQVTPIYLADQWRNIDWNQFLTIWQNLKPDEKEVGRLIGIEECFIVKAMMGVVSRSNPKQLVLMKLHQRFYTALALNDLVNEMPISKVAEKYLVNKGVVQNLQQSASTFAGMVTAFCNRLGWSNLELLLSQFQERLQFGVQRELVDLVRLDLLNGQRARVLHNAGIKTISDLATSEPATIAQILHKAGPFNTNANSNGGQSSKSIWMLGKEEGMTESEAAQMIVHEARNFLQIELGLAGVVFCKDDETSEKENNEILEEDESEAVNDSRSKISIDLEESEVMEIVDSPRGLKTGVSLRVEDRSLREDSDIIVTGHLRKPKILDSPASAVTVVASTIKHSTPLQSQVLSSSFGPNVSNVNVPSPGHLSFTENMHSSPLQKQQKQQVMEDEFDFEKEFLYSQFETSVINPPKEEDETAVEAMATSFMDVSLVESEGEPELKENVKVETAFLSESILAAAAAIAAEEDEGSDCSDDLMPPSPEIITQRVRTQQRLSLNRSPSALKRLSPTILQDEMINGTIESSFCSQKASFRIFEKEFQVKKIKKPEFLPINCFQSNGVIGFGLCIVPATCQSTPNRIGHRILGRRPSSTRRVESPPHSLAFCNGFTSTIWVFEWQSTNSTGLEMLMRKLTNNGVPLSILDAKSKIQLLLENSSLKMNDVPKESDVYDPKIAQWLLRFEEDRAVSRDEMIRMWIDSEDIEVLYRNSDWTKEVTESLIAWKLMTTLKERLDSAGLWEHFLEIETQAIRPLILMELNGFGIDDDELGRVKEILEFNAALLELRAYQIAGRQFNLSSSKEIKQILGHDLGLEDEFQGRGTRKQVLSKVNHELARLILDWRKITTVLTKSVVPFNTEIRAGRIHGRYSHFTVTGRVVMSEPSLQCLPRDFSVSLFYDQTQVEEIRHYCRIKFGNKVSTLLAKVERLGVVGDGFISVRNAFVAHSPGFLLLSADYSQLELRILAYLAQERKLLRILNAPNGDVFREIAAQWKGIPETAVNDELRQEAKGITYGIIYGMGTRSLSEQLGVGEEEAAEFIRGFMWAYPGIRTFIDQTIRKCREMGYVETISGRRRYLEHINSNSTTQKARAERQAVNTKIQGSASDLVKKAMIEIHNSLSKIYTSSANPITWTAPDPLKGIFCFPILNLHDELIYEVRESYLLPIATEIKRQMESCHLLNVQTPVVIKTGPTWGQLSPLQL